ncbi:MAG: glutaredoxin domain-containing protein [Promethearchaeota archaeon]
MKIKAYVMASCPYCNMAKEYFQSKGIEFTSVDIEKNRAASVSIFNRARQTGVPIREIGVPIIDINGELILGFDVPKIEETLKRKKS